MGNVWAWLGLKKGNYALDKMKPDEQRLKDRQIDHYRAPAEQGPIYQLSKS